MHEPAFRNGWRLRPWHRIRKLLAPLLAGADTTALLDDKTLRRIGQLAQSPALALPVTICESRELLAGEQPAAFAGAGTEFAEHREYQPGDSPRFINWRLYGRTGKLFVRRFHEEKRAQVVLLVDRRAPMWFGTRVRLKVARAVAEAVCLTEMARLQRLQVGAVVAGETLDWYPPTSRATALSALMQAINRGGSARRLPRPNVALREILVQMRHRITPGSIVFLISDFNDLAESHVPLLYALAEEHTVIACHVRDVMETCLPPHGRFHIADARQPGTVQVLDCDDPARRAVMQQILDSRQETVRRLLAHGGTGYSACLTDDPLEALVPCCRRGAR